jgi:hypothetical protein
MALPSKDIVPYVNRINSDLFSFFRHFQHFQNAQKGQCFLDDFEALVREIYVRG